MMTCLEKIQLSGCFSSCHCSANTNEPQEMALETEGMGTDGAAGKRQGHQCHAWAQTEAGAGPHMIAPKMKDSTFQ